METYMRRALQLAALSPYETHPNPMVGAVIVGPDGQIIGEGWHRRCGTAHAEVNAVNSVPDKSLLRDATIYVTLEPCSHYGKTPPCAQLIIDMGIPRVAVAAVDPFEKVAGRGIKMLREAGVDVTVGVLEEEARKLNHRFFTAHTTRRPFVTLKWAQSIDGFMDRKRTAAEPAARFSTPATLILVHKLRAEHDTILTSAATVIADNPSMTTRLWHGPSPRRVVLDRSGRLTPGYRILADASSPTLLYRPTPLGDPGEEWVEYPAASVNAGILPAESHTSLQAVLSDLYKRGITSVLVEAGPRLLQAFIDADLWDAARIETANITLGADGAHPAPRLTTSPTLPGIQHLPHPSASSHTIHTICYS